MSGTGGCNCDPESIFELAERTLDPEREREVRTHLQRCPGCRDLYEQDMKLTTFLCSLEFSKLRSRSVCREVTMALPTRPYKARLLWAILALGLFVAALLALNLYGTNPLTSTTSIVEMLFGMISGFAGVFKTVLKVAGSVILVALAVGALADLLIAAAVLSATRRRSREA